MELTRKNLEDQLRSNKCILKSYKLDLIEFHDNDHIKSHIERYSNKIKAIESALESMKQDSIQE